MPHCNVLIGCDQAYYDKWGIELLNSVKRHNLQVNLHCHIINPEKENKLTGVDITTEQRIFVSEDSRIAYLQAARFLVAAEKFSNNESVIILDADSICTRSFDDLELLFSKKHILKHHKEDRWLAGFVTFIDNSFRQEYSSLLKEVSVDEWSWGRDQLILNHLSREYEYEPLPVDWMSIGKNRYNSVFLTLKGEQKETDKYLDVYRKYLK
jgi:hypothetical protein